MSGKRKPVQLEFDPMALPDLPDLPDLDLMDTPDAPDIDSLMNPPKKILDERIEFGANAEENSDMVDKVVVEEFAAIHAGRKQQQEAVDLANDTEFWFAMYFQSREQKEAFLKAVKWFEHGDKYIDGRWVAKRMGIELPERPAPYKVGKLDRKLTDLT